MQRAVTAIYRSHEVANLVRDELERLGIGHHQITVIPDSHPGAGPATATAGTGTNLGDTAALPPDGSAIPPKTYPDTASAGGVHADAFDRLHDLHLPESDTRTYQQVIRNGDVVVSVSVDDDASLGQIEEIMRRPEDAHDLDELDTRYSGADYVPRRQPLGEGYDERQVGRREDEQLSPYTRYYRRDLALTPALALAPLGTR